MELKDFNGGRYAAIILPNGFEKSYFKSIEGQDLRESSRKRLSLKLQIKAKDVTTCKKTKKE